ncbi:MAG: methionine biosynthesis protein MetW [Desulfovibrio sp.]|nr:MAG: methionine biosynthesis protein MetW [Desulfovibrio sp.]
MRFDLQVIASWIDKGSRVLDLGCGKGDLLQHLTEHKGVRGSGIEISEDKVARLIAKGLSVVQGDINREIQDYPDQCFDYVVLSQTLQQVYEPAVLIQEMLRVGARGIVSFPNFGHWRIRAQLLFRGRAPLSRELPYEWYDTPNIRVISMKDFQNFCHRHGFSVLKRVPIDTDYHESEGHLPKILTNLRATYGIFLLGQDAPPEPQPGESVSCP